MRFARPTCPRQPAANAFTLVELLAVIGIIALLIGMLMPVLSKARAAANRAVCLSNIRQLGVGILMYCNDNKGWFPTCAHPDDGTAFKQYPDDWIWWQANRDLNQSAIAKYVGRGEKLKALLFCPSDTRDGRKTLGGIMPGQGPYLYGYSMSDSVGENVRSGQMRTKITWWRAPWSKILLTETWEKYRGAGWSYGVPLTKRHGSAIFHGNFPGNPIQQYGAKLGSLVSTFFVDGHADGIDEDFAVNEMQTMPRTY